MNIRLRLIEIVCVVIFSLFVSCKQTELKLTIENPSSVDRQEELVAVPLSEVQLQMPLSKNESYLVLNEQNNRIVSQQTFDGYLIFKSTLKAKENKTFTIKSTSKVFEDTLEVSGRHFPERYGDFAWENSKLGFRLYGKELKQIQAGTSGIDLWYKRTNRLILEEWYEKDIAKEASYHIDHGEGCDPYPVGQTLGGGTMAIVDDNKLYLNENFESFEILDQGALRITFKVHYPNQQIGNHTIKETRTISLDANCQLTKVIQEFKSDSTLTVGAGFAKRANGDSILWQKSDDYFVYQEPMDSINGQIFLGILYPQGIEDVQIIDNTTILNTKKVVSELPNIVGIQNLPENGIITYYTGFGWNKSGFQDVLSFQLYMKAFSESIAQPFNIKYQ